MKSKRLVNKRLLRLNKKTIANLNHREMIKIKVGAGEGVEVYADSEAQYTRCCNLDTVTQETLPNFSFVQDCKPFTGLNTNCVASATYTC